MEFGRRLREIRTDIGMSQSGLARAAETSQSAISQIEIGSRDASLGMVRRLARGLGISGSYLVAGHHVDNTLSRDEIAHLRVYRSLPERKQAQVRRFARFLKHEGAAK